MEPRLHDEPLPPSRPPSSSDGMPTHASETPGTDAGSRQFHHYEICLREDGTPHELGRGAMGVSYKARDVNLDAPVAIKVISLGLPTPLLARERFRREARAAAALRHPHVASVFHFGETPTGTCFYAMEFIEGETLAARVQRDGPLPAAMVMEIALQVTDALIAADERGLVHRDLKPANIMLLANARGGPLPPARTGSSGSSAAAARPMTVKVIDFGLAKAVSDTAGIPGGLDAPLTQEGGFLGTPAYASPEQAEGGDVDARSDIYSLGVTLWFLLTGKVPFTGRSFDEIYDRQRSRTLPAAQLAAAHVPAPLAALLKSMLAAEPTRRPASPHALYEALMRCREEMGGPTAVRLLAGEARRSRRGRIAAWAGVAALLLAGGAAAVFFLPRQSVPAPAAVDSAPARSIAVLPLEDLSADKSEGEGNFFADGIQDDVLNSLAKIKTLKVISRSSVMGYRQAATRNLARIGQELGVATVLEGSVRRAPGRVIVDAALIDVRDGHQLWSERYDRTLADALTLQGELATEIAAALQATLSPAEKARVEDRPTRSADAYVLYLRARDYQTRPYTLMQDYLTAERLYKQALEIDPDFALAHAQFSSTLSFIYLTFRPTPETRSEARAEAEAALRLRPDSGEGHVARALCLYWTEKNYPEALRELEVASRLLPGSAEVDMDIGAIRRRQGRWREALASIQRATVHDPRDSHNAWETMRTNFSVRDWPAAARAGDRVVALAPDNALLKVERGCVDFWSRGDLAAMRAALAKVPAGFDPDGETTLLSWDTALLGRDFAAAERVVSGSNLESVVAHFGIVLPRSYLLGYIAEASGDGARARPLFEAARPAMETDARNLPLDAFRQARLGLLYAFLGRQGEAVELGRRAMELLPETRDASSGAQVAGLAAMIHARAGDPDGALALIDHLLRTPGAVLPNFEGSITRNDLRARWQWDSLRADPRFQAMVNGPEVKTVY